MSVSRRKFLKSAAFLSAAFALKPGSFVLGHGSMRSNRGLNSYRKGGASRVQLYSRSMFEPYLGDTFRVRVGKQTIGLKLVALTDIKPGSAGITTGKTALTDCFSMRFQASRALPAPAAVHTLDHSALGAFDLFMIQTGEGAGFSQTAIVNHLV